MMSLTGFLSLKLSKNMLLILRAVVKQIIAGILTAVLLTAAACDNLLIRDQPLPTAMAELKPESPDWLSVYFSDPDSTTGSNYRGGPDEALAESIRKARVSVDMAMHFLNLWSIRDALIETHRRGVPVRVVTESDNLDVDEIIELKEAGIPVLGDRREGRMHNKFVVIDRQEVWTGSINLSVMGAYYHDNNLLHLKSAPIAENYTVEFEEMFLEDRFGPGSPANTPNQYSNVNGVNVETYFSPEDHPAHRIKQLIQNARESIDFLAYSFTLDELADAMVASSRRGVQVRGVFDEGQSRANAGTEFYNLLSAGLDVRLDGNENKMHHKIIIIDESIVITGSYNFSVNAETVNDENVIIIHSKDFAKKYEQEFTRVFIKSRASQ
jgi:phosphatidylserine/phosphatidylglycerophosphate/cardiolipin synthase-like enzyme